MEEMNGTMQMVAMLQSGRWHHLRYLYRKRGRVREVWSDLLHCGESATVFVSLIR